jgi:Outer membrane protein beta-barrel family
VNPFRFYINPYSYFTGNPLLQPSFSHNLELSYLYKGILSFTLYGTKISNGFGDLTFIEDGFIITSPRNYLTQYSGGIIVTFNKKLFPWWENSSYATYNVSDSRSSIPNVDVQSGSGFNYSVNNTFKLAKTVNAFLNYSQSLPSTQGNLHTYSQYSLSTGLRATLLSSKLQLGLTLFKGSLVKYRMFYKDFDRYINTDYDYKTLTLSATYIFGKKKVRGNTKNINFGEKQRAN